MLLLLIIVAFPFIAGATSTLEKGIVTFTFDDGDISLNTNAVPIFSKYGVPLTAYIIPNEVGEGYAVSWEQLRDMQRNDSVEVANHTWSHPSLLTLTSRNVKLQITQAEARLAEEGISISGALAPPFGEYNATTINIMKNLGTVTSSRQAWTGNGDYLNKPATFNRWELKVVGLSDAPTFNDMEYVIDQAVAQKAWVIFVFHGVWPVPETEYEMTPELLEQVVSYADYLRKQGTLEIMTISRGVAKLGYYKLK